MATKKGTKKLRSSKKIEAVKPLTKIFNKGQ